MKKLRNNKKNIYKKKNSILRIYEWTLLAFDRSFDLSRYTPFSSDSLVPSYFMNIHYNYINMHTYIRNKNTSATRSKFLDPRSPRAEIRTRLDNFVLRLAWMITERKTCDTCIHLTHETHTENVQIIHVHPYRRTIYPHTHTNLYTYIIDTENIHAEK